MYHRIMAVIVLCVQFCSSCTNGAEELRNIEEILPEDPASALKMLEDLPAESLTTRKARAHHSLLTSIALDKNGHDICSDSIIADALSYYSRNGKALDRCRTFYYTARIHENSMDHEVAMTYLYKAEKLLEDIGDNHLKSLIYSTKGRLYFDGLEYGRAAADFSNAAEHCLLDLQTSRWASNKLREGVCRLHLKEYDTVRDILISLEKHMDGLSASSLNKYYQLHISYDLETSSARDSELISEYIHTMRNRGSIDWLLLARVSIAGGDSAGALDYLEEHLKHHPADAGYHYIHAQASELAGNMEKASESYKSYIALSGDIGERILSQETRFIEERQMHQEQHRKDRSHRSILYLTITAILLALAFAAEAIVAGKRQLKIRRLEHEEMARQIDELIQEREELAMLENRNREGRDIIAQRLRIIDQFVISDAFNDRAAEAKASETLRKIISDRSEFVRQNRLIFNQSASRFIDFLAEKGLTDTEIDCCCLYAIGMNGKMVMTFTNTKRHYHIGSDVRKKLGLNSHDTNISIHIRNLYHTLGTR